MTLVVARSNKDRISIVADTLLTAHDTALPLSRHVLKSCCLPGYLCVSYCGSPDLAAKAFFEFKQTYPDGTSYDGAVRFFEQSSHQTGNHYILAFGAPAKLTTIRDGHREKGPSKTHWIGDKQAFNKFREYERRHRRQYLDGRAVNTALFADEMSGSPASDLHGIMRNIIADPEISSVGGFVTVLSNRDIGFRFSSYSDVLFDWPKHFLETRALKLTDNVNLATSGENNRYSESQISPGYYNMNIVAFYLLRGRLLIVLLGCHDGIPGQCLRFPNVEPVEIATTISENLGFDFRPLCIVMSSREEFPLLRQRDVMESGIAMNLFCEVNTFPEPPSGNS